MIYKRATKQLEAAGIQLVVRKGFWGPYLYDPALNAQKSICHDTPEECVQAAVAGERPTPAEPFRKVETPE